MVGTVSYYYEDRGYGFIVTDEIEESVFVHITQVLEPNPPTLCKKQLVSFDLARNTDGYIAQNVKPLKLEVLNA